MIKHFLSNKIVVSSFAILLLLLCALSYKHIIFSYPAYIHAWAQADRYALALCFIDNGFDFFHPCTFNYNLQFPAPIPLLKDEGITSVDFPLVEYVIAIVMKVSGSTSPVIFRTSILCVSLTGLLFLYKLSRMLIQSALTAFIICLFVFLSPVFNYYQIGFLPSIPALSCLFIAFYFYAKQLQTDAYRTFLLAICFFTLAALLRFPFIIFLIALCAMHFLQMIKTKSFLLNKTVVLGSAFLLIGYYFIYNMYLRNTYGSIFLGHSMPAQSLSEFVALFTLAAQHWGLHYFTFYQYVFIALILSLFAVTLKFSHVSHVVKLLLQILMIAGVGCSMYAVLMMQQFPDHDYYFLDTLYPVIILSLVFIMAAVYNKIINNTFKIVVSLCLSLLLFLSYADFKEVLDERYLKGQWKKMELNDRIYFEGADVFLDSIGISKDASMLVVGTNTTNLPFILMKRKGYAQLHTHPDSIRKGFTKADYVVLKNDEFYNEILLVDSSLIKDLVNISDNGFISIYKIVPNETAELKSFIGFSDKDIFKKILYAFENNFNADKIKNIPDTSDVCFSKPYGGYAANEYGLTVELSEHDFPDTKKLQLMYTEVELYGTIENQTLELIVQVLDSTGQSIYFKGFPLKRFVKKNEWKKACVVFAVPPMIDSKTARVFFWNPEEKPYYYDDFKLYIKN